MKSSALTSAILLTIGLVGCSKPEKPTEVPMTGFYSELKTCRARYAEFDARIDAAGVRDPAFYRIPGFPYLRTDRLLASYKNDVKTVDEVGGWVRRLRESDQEAREFELENLGLSKQEVAIERFEFLNCGRGLAGLELDDPKNFKLLLKEVQPPADYSKRDRTLGFYPLTLPLLRSRIADMQAQIRSAFAQPIEKTLDGKPPLRWEVEPVEDLSLIPRRVDDTEPDELGTPGLTDSGWRAIAEFYSPPLLTADGKDMRELGTPVWTEHGIDVDTTRPWVNYQITFVRFGGRALIQVAYFFWFHVPPNELVATTQAPIDGLVWRVTLDLEMKPIAFESVRASGREHFWFQGSDKVTRKSGDGDGQAAFFPAPGVTPSSPMLVLEPASGGVRKVVDSVEAADATKHRYILQRYEDLYRLPKPGGGTRSLFEPDGRVPGSNSPATDWMRASGVTDPGALRHLARMPLDYIGQRHFDDPFLLDSAFATTPFEQLRGSADATMGPSIEVDSDGRLQASGIAGH